MVPTTLFAEAAKLLDGDITFSHQSTESYITIALPEGRKQGVRLSLVQHQFAPSKVERTLIHVDSLVGPMNGTIDPEYLLECMRELAMARISILNDASQLIALEGRLPLDHTTPDLLASLIMETASCADTLEQVFFDVDLY